MSVELRKKSNSLSNAALSMQQRTLSKNQRTNPLSACRSVSAFNDTSNNQTNRRPNVQKFSIQNNSFCNTKRNYESNKNISNHTNSYKQAVDKRKKKALSGKKSFQEEFFSTIDTFHEALCSLPLDKLILSQNPYQWVELQMKTLDKLEQKYQKIQQGMKNQQKNYYGSKIDNVKIILKNIRQNLQTLNKMSLLKNYTSGGTSIQSRNSQSSSSLGTTQNFQKKSDNKFLKNKINQGGNFATQYEGSQNAEDICDESQKQNQIRFSNQKVRISQPSKSIHLDRIFTKDLIAQKDQFILKDKISSSSSIQREFLNFQTVRSEKLYDSSVLQSDQKANFIKNAKSMQQSEQNASFIRKDDSQAYSFLRNTKLGQTVPKYSRQQNEVNDHRGHFYISQESKQTFNTLANENMQQSTQFCQQTKRQTSFEQKNSLCSQLEVGQLKNELKIKNQIIRHLETKHQKLVKINKQEFSKKQKHYLQTIYELKKQFSSRQASIRQLLMENQARENQIQNTQKQVKQKAEINRKLTQNLQTLQESVQVLTNQIRQFKIRQEQSRQTVHLQRQRTKKSQLRIDQLQQNIVEFQNKINADISYKQTMLQQINDLTKKNQIFQIEREKEKQKQEIYKKKYFRLNADFQKFKQKVKEDSEYWKKICLKCKRQYHQDETNDEKHTQLRQLINFHKKRLLA